MHFFFFLASGCLGNGDTSESLDSDCEQEGHFPTLTADPANSNYPDPEVQVTCTKDTLQVQSNGIPDYEYVATTPNELRAQDWNWEIARLPQRTGVQDDIPLLGTAGFTVNGMPIYGPNEAEFPDPFGDPIFNEVTDPCQGHPGGRGDYHYHALLAACVLGEDNGTTEPSPVFGYALDGYPIYGPRGCGDAECTEVVEYKSSWETTGDPTTYAWDANECTRESCDEADGEYLDRCNGRTGPDGAYRYHATSTFPYILGCFAGEPSDDAGGGAPPTP
jgi:hypothetical protein